MMPSLYKYGCLATRQSYLDQPKSMLLFSNYDFDRAGGANIGGKPLRLDLNPPGSNEIICRQNDEHGAY